MIRKMGFRWNLRRLMAEQGMFATSDLVPLLAERGVHLSREQVYRLVTQPPQRLSMDALAAVCDILGARRGTLSRSRSSMPGSARPLTAARIPGNAPQAARRAVIRRPGQE